MRDGIRGRVTDMHGKGLIEIFGQRLTEMLGNRIGKSIG